MDGRLEEEEKEKKENKEEKEMETEEAKPRGEEAGSGRRLYFVDNIRSFVIVQVVVLHAAVTYSGLGMWYYQEAAAP